MKKIRLNLLLGVVAIMLASCTSYFGYVSDGTLASQKLEIMGIVQQTYSTITFENNVDVFLDLEQKARRLYGKDVTIQIISSTSNISLFMYPFFSTTRVTARVVRIIQE